MAGLVLKLRPKERFMVNGVVLQNGDKRSNIVIVSQDVNVLRLRDAIHPEDAKTPVKRVCYITQLVLAGEADANEASFQILRGIEQLSQIFRDADSKSHLDRATDAIGKRQFYQALKSLRALLAREERLLSVAKAS